MSKKQVWYGSMEFGEFKKGQDLFPCAIIHEIRSKAMLDDEDIEIYLDTYGYDSYLVPGEYAGEVFFSKNFIQGGIQ